jgi:hypothetical protein
MKQNVFQKIENAQSLDFVSILSKSFNLFKNVWQEALTHVLVSMIVVIPMIILIYLPYFMFIFYATDGISYASYDSFGGYDQPDLTPFIPFFIIYFILVFVIIFIAQALILGITAHFFKVVKKIDTNSTEEVEGYFSFIKGNLNKLFMLSLASFGIALLAMLLCYLPIFYVMVPLQLIVVFFAFNSELSVSETIKASFKLGNKFWLIIFGLIIISSMIAQLGILLCIVGLFFTAYFVHLPMYYVYKDSIGFEDDID